MSGVQLHSIARTGSLPELVRKVLNFFLGGGLKNVHTLFFFVTNLTVLLNLFQMHGCTLYSGMLRWCGGATILIDLIRPVLTPMQSRELPTAPPWCEY